MARSQVMAGSRAPAVSPNIFKYEVDQNCLEIIFPHTPDHLAKFHIFHLKSSGHRKKCFISKLPISVSNETLMKY